MTTKLCPHCGGDNPVSLVSLKSKLCSHCRQIYDWPLEPGQKPLFDGTGGDGSCVPVRSPGQDHNAENNC